MAEVLFCTGDRRCPVGGELNSHWGVGCPDACPRCAGIGGHSPECPVGQTGEGHEHYFVAEPDRPDHRICCGCGLPA